MFAELAIPSAVDKLFTYSIPDEFRAVLKPGMRVVAPFGNRSVTGIVIRLSAQSPVAKTKALLDVLDTEPSISGELLGLVTWMADYYLAAPGDIIKAMLVQGAAKPGKRIITLLADDSASASTKPSGAPLQAEILRALREKSPRAYTQLQKLLGKKNLTAPLAELARKGLVRVEEQHPFQSLKAKTEPVVAVDEASRARWEEWLSPSAPDASVRRAARQRAILKTLLERPAGDVAVTELLKEAGAALSSLRSLQQKGLVAVTKREVLRRAEYDLYASSLGAQNIVLNAHQERALGALRAGLAAGAFQTYLLHGVTGSGKTQVYIEAIRDALAAGKTAIVLVPEIALTPQIVRRFTHHFGGKVVALHSRMSVGERYDAWRRTKEGAYSIVIGPRSAVFAPLKNLGLIIVDEEHEPSYKQFDQTPRYHARDVAIMRGSQNKAVVVLGSATPSLESYANALNGKHTLLELPERVDNAQLPAIAIVDMTAERRRKLDAFRAVRLAEFKDDREKARANKRKFEFGSISDLLRDHIGERLKRKEGVILLQNRRGFSPFVECPECGHVEMCDNCNITMTYHQTHDHLRCHYCGLVRRAPDRCPQCQSADIAYRGVGTQRVEEELHTLFPGAVTLRMDMDTTSKRGAHDAILRAFSEGEADILLGTQMVAKGLDFSRVTLVGVISADTQMLLPDFRSSERTFQLLTQVAGRAGRSALTGEVVIQTCQPRHETLQHVIGHDYAAFYRQEIAYRQELSYPPFSRIALIEFKGASEGDVIRHAEAFAKILRERRHPLTVLGPAAAAIQKLKGSYRWHVVVKGVKSADPSGRRLHDVLKDAVAAYGRTSLGRSGGVRMIVDVDPQGMM
jgi:primosomal protein N' (replication factor Y)